MCTRGQVGKGYILDGVDGLLLLVVVDPQRVRSSSTVHRDSSGSIAQAEATHIHRAHLSQLQSIGLVDGDGDLGRTVVVIHH